MSIRLFVGNLPFNATTEDVRSTFAQAGEVSHCEVVIDRMTNRSRGFAFVEMPSQEEANRAIEMFNGKDLNGRSMTVNEARPREERAPRREFGARPPRRDFGGGDRRR